MRRPLRRDDDYNEYVKDFYRKIEDYDWNRVADHWSGPESLLHRSREKALIRLIGQYGHGQRYLDVGCGTGLILRHLPAGAVGIDLNPLHLERAARYVPQATVQAGDAEKLSFADGSFSTVVCTEMLEHLVEPEKALAEIYRVLEPGGRLLGSTPRWSLVWRFRFLSSTHYHNEPFHNEFTFSEVRKMFAPFKVLELRTIFLRANFLFALEKPATAAAAPRADSVPRADRQPLSASDQAG